MIDTNKLGRIINKMQENGLSQIIVTHPTPIRYLTGLRLWPGERMLALLIRADGNHRFFINRMSQQEDQGIPITYYDDTEDPIALLAACLTGGAVGIDKDWQAKFLLRLMELRPDLKYVNSSAIIDRVRQIKDAHEQELMIRSSQLNDEVMADIMAIANQRFSEKELNAKILDLYKAHGVDRVSFMPMSAYGRGAADPHHDSTEDRGRRGDCALFDVGGEYEGYCSDMTRTFFLGEVSDRHRLIYETVLGANLAGIAAAKPGNKMSDVDKAARDYITERGFGEYFTHRTGHSIGIEDHEPGDVSLANDAPIEPGMCFSVEPGIYIPEENIGVRIEDLVLITEDGCRVLNEFPKELTILPFPEE